MCEREQDSQNLNIKIQFESKFINSYAPNQIRKKEKKNNKIKSALIRAYKSRLAINPKQSRNSVFRFHL